MNELRDDPALRCAECGASRVDGMTCWEQLGAIIAWESEDPELLAEHFLTVASYNLQHPGQFTEEALADLRAAFVERLDRGTTVEEIRRRMARAYEGQRRVLRDEAEREQALRAWGMTIADVYVPARPGGAAERVRRWAGSIRKEL